MSDEIRRRAVHASGSGLPVLYLLDQRFDWGVVTWEVLQVLAVVGALLALALEALRLSGAVQWAIYDDLTREYEQEYLAGYALYMIGMAVAALAFDPQVAVPALLMLTIADPISGLLGSGSLAKQTWVLLATFGVCVLLAAPFVPPAVAVAGALAATLADGLKPVIWTYVIDDNLTIPIGAGLAMWAALRYVPAVG